MEKRMVPVERLGVSWESHTSSRVTHFETNPRIERRVCDTVTYALVCMAVIFLVIK